MVESRSKLKIGEKCTGEHRTVVGGRINPYVLAFVSDGRCLVDVLH